MDPTGAIPLIARIGGLPVTAVAPFASELLAAVERRRQLDERLAGARAELVERLHAAIAAAPDDRRRIFLSLKRDGFNGRSLRKHRSAGHWGLVLQVLGPLAETILHLEEESERLDQALATAHGEQAERERRALLPWLADGAFLRGVALSSPVLVENLHRLQRSGATDTRRRLKRLELSLLRYVSRAALKPSPFSTLTRIGLLLAAEGPGADGLELAGEESWTDRSTLQLQHSVCEQLVDLLARYPAFRRSLCISLNETIEARGGDRFVFVRRGIWAVNAESRQLSYARPSLVNVRVRGAPVEWLSQCPAVGPQPYPQLLADLQAAFPARTAAALRGAIDQLIEVGFLCWQRPWEATELAPDRQLLRHLERMVTGEPGPSLADITLRLRRVIALLAGYQTASRPDIVATEAKREVRELLQRAARLAGDDLDLPSDGLREWPFHEDVFVHSNLPAGAVAHLSAERARELLADLAPLSRLSNVYSNRHDFLHALAALAADRWPHGGEIPFLDVLEAAVPLFQSYVKWDVEVRGQGNMAPRAFDPFGLAPVATLRRCRETLTPAAIACLERDGEVMRLDATALTKLLDTVPGPYAAVRDFCAFLQPTDDSDRGWVVNLLSEGRGRLSSRFTVAMDPAARSLFSSFFLERSQVAEDGELCEIVDIFCPAGNTANAHVLQTPRVLIAPGQSLASSPERCLTLRDLRVRLPGSGRLPQLVDDRGRRLLPVHLGAVSFRSVPMLSKLLAMFGPGEMRTCAPLHRRRAAGPDGIESVDRHAIGDVVYRRRTWSFDAAALSRALVGLSPARAFVAINRWRAERRIPERGFLREPLAGTGPNAYTKPQYVDFSSCLLVELFRTIVDRGSPTLRLTEALPDHRLLAAGAHPRRLAIEIQLDATGFTGLQAPASPALGGGGNQRPVAGPLEGEKR